MLYSKPYSYYRDKDNQNLSLKLRYAAKTGISIGGCLACFDISGYNKPKTFAHLFSIFGKWFAIAVVGSCIHSGLTYSIAKYTESEHWTGSHFAGALGIGLMAGIATRKPFDMFVVTMAAGGWAAYQKSKMMKFNTVCAFDPAYIRGNGGLFQGQFQSQSILKKHFFDTPDPGRRLER